MALIGPNIRMHSGGIRAFRTVPKPCYSYLLRPAVTCCVMLRPSPPHFESLTRLDEPKNWMNDLEKPVFGVARVETKAKPIFTQSQYLI